jgi:hypothetical protein
LQLRKSGHLEFDKSVLFPSNKSTLFEFEVSVLSPFNKSFLFEFDMSILFPCNNLKSALFQCSDPVSIINKVFKDEVVWDLELVSKN